MTKIILLVEDDPSDAKLTLLAFEACGVTNEIVVERDGPGALDYLFCTGAHLERAADRAPSLVLLDLKLPRIDGLEVLRRIRQNERTKLMPVVVLTSSREERDVRGSYSLGANAYLRKPMDFGELTAAARTLGFFWLHLNEPSPTGGPGP